MKSRVLDLNTAERPTLDLTLQDEARTTLRLKMPTEGLINELQQIGGEVRRLESGDREAIDTIYEMAAKLISCNRDYIKVTAEELRGKYRMDLESAIVFFSDYMGFIEDIKSAKN